MDRKMLIIPPGPAFQREERVFSTPEPPLEMIQELVGGYIEIVPQQFKLDGKVALMYVNEDGISKQLPANEAATMLTGGFHAIYGTAVLVQR